MNAPPLDLRASEEALSVAAVFRRRPRDLIRVVGPQAREYLQGQCTQELSDLEPGAARFALVLSVQGKFEGFVRVRALEEDAFVLDTLAGQGAKVLERLRRFKIRTKAELSLEQVELVEVRGPAAVAPPETGDALVLPVFPRPGVVGVDLLGAPADPPLVPAGDPGAFVVQRIVAGIPEPVSELTDQTIPFEAGIVAETTSFTKGCYTGQELIARLDARGAKVPRRLRGVLVEADRPDERVAAGTALLVEGREVGRLTSVAFSPQRAAIVALAYVARGVEPPAEALLSPDAGGRRARIHALPLDRG